MIFQFRNQHFHLHPYKAIFWEEQQCLLIADVHLGKIKHFRKSGIAVPMDASNENWDKLISLLIDYQPIRVLFLGDLFHSQYNDVWEELKNMIQQFSNIQFTLIKGNHDILAPENYESATLEVLDELIINDFWLTHHPQENIPTHLYNLAGHLHPSVVLRSNAQQHLRLACFHFGEQQGILPAFGSFTGTANIQVRSGDRVFVIVEDKVMEVS